MDSNSPMNGTLHQADSERPSTSAARDDKGSAHRASAIKQPNGLWKQRGIVSHSQLRKRVKAETGSRSVTSEFSGAWGSA